jgi:site-specific recombinase XerD
MSSKLNRSNYNKNNNSKKENEFSDLEKENIEHNNSNDDVENGSDISENDDTDDISENDNVDDNTDDLSENDNVSENTDDVVDNTDDLSEKDNVSENDNVGENVHNVNDIQNNTKKTRKNFRDYAELKKNLTNEQKELIGELVENTPNDTKEVLNERKWTNFIDYYNIKTKQDLLDFDISKITKISTLFNCKRSHFIEVLCSPPYSLIDTRTYGKNFKDNLKLQNILTNEQKELIAELIENTPDDIKDELTEIKWGNFIDYYGIESKQYLLDFNFSKVTNTETMFYCKRSHFAEVLCSPPYSLTTTKKIIKYDSLLCDEQKEMLLQLKKYLTAMKYNYPRSYICAFSLFLYKLNDINKESIKNTETIQKMFNDNEFGRSRSVVMAAINLYYESIKHTEKLISREMYLLKNKKSDMYKVGKKMLEYAKNFNDNKEWFLSFIEKLKIYMKVKNFKTATFRGYFYAIVNIFECLRKDNLINKDNVKNITIKQFVASIKKNYDPKKINSNTLSHINSIIIMKIFPKINYQTVIRLEDIIDDKKIIDDIEIIDKRKIGDYFTDEQLEKIIAEANKNPKENLIVTIFNHTGMRLGGLQRIKMINIFDYETNKLLSDGWTFDKNKRRYFSIAKDVKLTEAFNRYFVEYPDIVKMKGYLFPLQNKLFDKHMGNQGVAKIIKKICERCNIDSSKIHTHMFRKTVVNKLIKSGNSMEKVAKFIGHSDPTTTFTFYWVPTMDDLTDQMIIPWLKNTETYTDLKDFGQLESNNINIDADMETTSSNVGKEYLSFIRKVYWPLKKNQEILKEILEITIEMLDKDSKNKYMILGDKTELEIIDKLKEIEKANQWDKSTIVTESNE